MHFGLNISITSIRSIDLHPFTKVIGLYMIFFNHATVGWSDSGRWPSPRVGQRCILCCLVGTTVVGTRKSYYTYWRTAELYMYRLIFFFCNYVPVDEMYNQVVRLLGALESGGQIELMEQYCFLTKSLDFFYFGKNEKPGTCGCRPRAITRGYVRSLRRPKIRIRPCVFEPSAHTLSGFSSRLFLPKKDSITVSCILLLSVWDLGCTALPSWGGPSWATITEFLQPSAGAGRPASFGHLPRRHSKKR